MSVSQSTSDCSFYSLPSDLSESDSNGSNASERTELSERLFEKHTPPFEKRKSLCASIEKMTGILESTLKIAEIMCATTCQAASAMNKAALDYTNETLEVVADKVITKTRNLAATYEFGETWDESATQTIKGSAQAIKTAAKSVSCGVEQAFLHIQNVTSSSFEKSVHAVQKLNGVLQSTGSFHSHPFVEVVSAMYEMISPLSTISPWKVSRAVVALSHVQKITREPYPPQKFTLLNFRFRDNRNVLSEFRQAVGVYSPSLLKVLGFAKTALPHQDTWKEFLGIEPGDIKFSRVSSAVHAPSFFVILDHSTRSICVIIRGSTEVADIFTDLTCRVDPATGAHMGMQRSAEFVDATCRPLVHNLSCDNPEYRINIIGHSLGGGTATLLCSAWLSDPVLAGQDQQRLHAYSFGSPCVTSWKLSKLLRNHVTSVIFSRDVVSRASWGSLRILNKIICHLCGASNSDLLRNSPIETPSFNNEKLSDSSEFREVVSAGIDNATIDVLQSRASPEIVCERDLGQICCGVSSYNKEVFSSFSRSSSTSSDTCLEEESSALDSENVMATFIDDWDHDDIRRKNLMLKDTLSEDMCIKVTRKDRTQANTRNSNSRSYPSITRTHHSLDKIRTETFFEWINYRHKILLQKENNSRDLTFETEYDQKMRDAMLELKSLEDDNSQVLCPAGRCLMLIPRRHVEKIFNIPKTCYTPGDCVIADLDAFEVLEMSSNIILQRAAFTDHGPQKMASALGVIKIQE